MTRMTTPVQLPIDAVLDELVEALARGNNAVLVAPPGAGKTTRVPLALRVAPWLDGRKILVLEPRRLAARNAAERMAATLGERVGQSIGMRARLGTRVGPNTRIEVVTDGVFSRMVIADPELTGVGAVLFDEFHERSLDADLGLALALDCQQGLRPDLRLLVMSATLEGERVAKLLGGAPVVESHGRAFPVETRYVGRDPARRLEDQIADVIIRSLARDSGSMLVFLPGQAEIRRVADRLAGAPGVEAGKPGVVIQALHGGMEAGLQDAAVAPAAQGQRKIVLATAIAETSLTIEGVRVVVDAGLARVPRYEPDIGVTRLETVRASRASVDQRRGRAGRTEPGICYRLWDEPQTQSLPAFADPEIRAADLSGLILDCAEWGVADTTMLAWLDPPPASAVQAAREDLTLLGALDGDGRITGLGRLIRSLPVPPRVARMIVRAEAMGCGDVAGEVAAILVERGLGGNDCDLAHRLAAFRRDRGRRASDMRRLASRWVALVRETSIAPDNPPMAAAAERDPTATRAAGVGPGSGGGRPARGDGGGGGGSGRSRSRSDGVAPSAMGADDSAMLARCLAAAYPDRIAKARGAAGQFLLANGRAGQLDATDALAREEFLVVAEMQGKAAQTRILLAVRASRDEIEEIASDRIETSDEVAFDATAGRVRARRVDRLGAIVLAQSARAIDSGDDAAAMLARGAVAAGVDRLPWSKAQRQLRDRIAFARGADADAWPDLGDQALSDDAGAWLAPFLGGKTRLAEITADDLGAALAALLPFDLSRRLDQDAPTHFTAPTGNRHAIDYEGDGAPRLSIRVQELFGLREHPAIAGGRLPLTLELLSPAMRPIQVTRDLPGFWAGSWTDVRAEMRGRYPKHVWPEDPASATATARAKPRHT
ncbi:MAG: ATP-dependent helicase HrpB [Hyphomicrobiaceae bacterium]|nr:ATP-dependent helicase HrpB [Hyphomicrobiaceae bacterium]